MEAIDGARSDVRGVTKARREPGLHNGVTLAVDYGMAGFGLALSDRGNGATH